jgi:hypothetical protein
MSLSGAEEGSVSYCLLSRKNWEGLEMGFVTVNCPPVTAGELVTSSQVAGRVRSCVDCGVKPTALVGQERTMALALGHPVSGIELPKATHD